MFKRIIMDIDGIGWCRFPVTYISEAKRIFSYCNNHPIKTFPIIIDFLENN